MKRLQEIIAHWWSDFTLQTRLMAGATLVVSLIMSGLTFWAVNTIQMDARLNDTRFGRDLGLLLSANVTHLIAQDNLTEVARFSHSFYSSTSSVRYMLYADRTGNIFLGIPFSESEVKNSLTIQRRIQLPENFAENSELPMVRQHQTPDGEVTDVFVPLTYESKFLGVLAIGINPNPTVVASSNLTRDVTIAVFISIWVMVILGAVFNALIITQPIKELLRGVKNIAAGNFRQRVDLPLGGELGELIFSFNEMAEQLERYDEQNIEELTAQKAKLETLVSTIADGAVLLDTNVNVILVNPTARRIFGWDTATQGSTPLPVGANILDYLPASVQEELKQPLYEITVGEKEAAEFRITLTQPANRTIRILLTTVLDQYRDIKGIAMTVQDITREVELNEAKSLFISGVTHELRTPLFNIKSYIETVHEYGENLTEQERREFLETANRETDRLTRLVNDVLDLSKLQSHKRYHFDAVDISQAVEQTLRNYQLNARDRDIELSQEIDPDLPPVLGNYDLLLQVFTNLVGNAVKFTKSGGRVVIRAYQLGGAAEHLVETRFVASGAKENEASSVQHHGMFGSELEGDRILIQPPVELDVKEKSSISTTSSISSKFAAKSKIQNPLVRIEVSDTGMGIDPEYHEIIFDRFERVENRVHTLEGTGLGLSIVKNIVEKHHSTVHLVSEVGVGTTFWFDLNIFQEKAASQKVLSAEC